MNKDRRKAIAAASEALEDIKAKLEEIKEGPLVVMNDETASEKTATYEKLETERDALEGVIGEIETARDEEQEYKDAMPESFQNGEKGERADQAVSDLEEAITNAEDAKGNIEEAMSKANKEQPEKDDDAIDSAIQSLDDAIDNLGSIE